MLSELKWCVSVATIAVLLVLCIMTYYQSATITTQNRNIVLPQITQQVYIINELREPSSDVLSSTSFTPSESSNECSISAVDEQNIHHDCDLYKVIYQPPASDRCSGDTDLFITVITSPTNAEARSVFRQTILSDLVNSKISYIFLIGYSLNSTTQQTVLTEAKQHEDMVIGNFQDSYQNLTIKSIFMLGFASTFCPQAKFYFKLDDDVYANLPSIHETTENKPQKSILGKLFHHAKPIMDKTNKWHVEHFKENYFPDYVSGTAYLLSSDIMKPLYQQAFRESFIRLEDVFVTGICAAHVKLNITHQDMKMFSVNFQTRPLSAVDIRRFFTIHGLTPTEILNGWKLSHT